MMDAYDPLLMSYLEICRESSRELALPLEAGILPMRENLCADLQAEISAVLVGSRWFLG